MHARERFEVRIEQRAFHEPAADGIRPIQHEDGDPAAPGFLHHVDERAQVRVVARADVLDVEDERGDVAQHRGVRSA